MDEAGLETSSYGSYYRVGIENEYSFEEVLETAVILKRPTDSEYGLVGKDRVM